MNIKGKSRVELKKALRAPVSSSSDRDVYSPRENLCMERRALKVESGLRWYLLQTKPRKEPIVAKMLRELKLEVFLPWVRTRRRIGNLPFSLLTPLFPRYIFCPLDMVLSGKAARYAPGVKDFVRFGNEIAEVGEEVVKNMLNRCPDGVAVIKPPSYNPGEKVMIKEGPFSGLEAIFERGMSGCERIAVLFDILGRRTRLVLSKVMIERA